MEHPSQMFEGDASSMRHLENSDIQYEYVSTTHGLNTVNQY